MVSTIEGMTFDRCSELSDVKLPDNLKVIKSHAFSNCNSLRTIFLPCSIMEVETAAFYGCPNLSSINIKDKTKNHFIGLLPKELRTLIKET